MEEWRRVRVEGEDNPKLKPLAVKVKPGDETSPVRERAGGTTGLMHVSLKKENPADPPPKVPRFQYVDFPSLHQCIQQLSVPPADSWLTGRSQGSRPTNQGSSASGERVPKFRYVDYPSLHHCIQQLSVPPLEKWSLALPKPGRDSKAGPGGLLLPPAGKEDTCYEHRVASGNKHDLGVAALPGRKPGASLVPHSVIPDTSPCQHQPSLGASRHLEAQTPIHSATGQTHSGKAGSDYPRKRPPGAKLRSSGTAANRKTASWLCAPKMGLPVHGPCSEPAPGPDQMRPKLCGTADSQQGIPKTLPSTPPTCAFCRKRFSDNELLKTHLKSHQQNPH
ncbi:uncharacterized protein si:ch211-284e13.6 isoform X2 [Megalops cyprinoides]|uniref:uncharacterized protein si:ch211-284e13.6 isoform X2 n=1 Tax=Megalops cyprinoides TaxID=118141 RepID=UPI0018652CAD|nr:uncharacterized protein si:ch211-284e13.6 isoform X2 [Megalops cyprinoides]